MQDKIVRKAFPDRIILDFWSCSKNNEFWSKQLYIVLTTIFLQKWINIPIVSKTLFIFFILFFKGKGK